MKKLLFSVLALFVLTFNVLAQQTEQLKEKEEVKKSNKKSNYNSNYNNWGGGERIVGEGPSVTETRDVKNFTGFKSSLSADITVKQTSGSFNVVLEGQKNIISLVKLEVVDGTLKIGFEKGYSVNHKEPLKVTIEAPSFAYMGMSGSGNVRAKSPLSGDKLTINISGSGNFDINDLKYNNLNVGISGSGDVDLAGSVETVELSISGSGDLNAENLKSQTARCRVSGSGDISLNVTKELDASISGSGDISYSGKPSSVHTRVSGSGDIKSK